MKNFSFLSYPFMRLLILGLLLFSTASFSQDAFLYRSKDIPAGYYDNAIGKTGAELKTALYNIIKGHTVISYSGLWTAYQTTDKRADGKVWDMYSNCDFTFGSDQCGNYSGECDCYNREHSMPKSWFNDVAPMNSDLFHVVPTDGYVNNRRGNYPFGEVTSPTYTSGNGSKLGSCSYPGYTGTVFEPVDEYKGDFARGYLYMATRYENIIAGWENYDGNGDAMLDGSSYPCFEPWAVNMLLDWCAQDPVSAKEIARNDAVYVLQHNRNPFIDHPEWANAVWGGTSCTAPTIQATTFSSSDISQTIATINWVRGNGNSILILARKDAAVNADPSDGSAYTGNSVFGSGTQVGSGNYVVYNGNGNTVTLSGLSSGTQYYFALYEYDSDGYCYNTTELTGNLTTLYKDEPSNYSTSFSISGTALNSITLIWSDATGTVIPDAYLILMSSTSFDDILVPVDGTPVPNSNIAQNVVQGEEIVSFTGLNSQTIYYFKIFPYSNSGNQINYKTDGEAPQISGATSIIFMITGNPISQTVCLNQNFTISTVAQAPGTLTYQWYHNGSLIPNETNSTLMINSVQNEDAGQYYCEVTYNGTILNSGIATLTVAGPVFAGSDIEITVFDTVQILNLFDSLSLNSTPDGTWYTLDMTEIQGGLFYPATEGSGTYGFYYIVTGNPCPPDTAEVTLQIDHYTGVSIFGENQLTIFPNPCKEYLSLQSYSKIERIEIVSNLGQILYSNKSIIGLYLTISTSNLKKGVYVIQVFLSNGNLVQNTFMKF